VDTPECSETILNTALTEIPKQTNRTLVGYDTYPQGIAAIGPLSFYLPEERFLEAGAIMNGKRSGTR
jgi:hypothetical protein